MIDPYQRSKSAWSCLRQGEHLLDHGDRELVREARHEVDLTPGPLAGGDRGRLTLQERPGELVGGRAGWWA